MKKSINKKTIKAVTPRKEEVKKAPEHEEEKLIHTWGKFVERPRRTETLVCACGNRYIKTRPRQTECIPCMVRHAHEKRDSR